jgi:LuxR family transcriptional regulator, maltose regulon positive regulatory protein
LWATCCLAFGRRRGQRTARFLAHLVAALRTVAARVGEGVLGALESPQPPPTEAILTAMLNEIATIEEDFVLVLDDYHVIDARPVDDALAFLLGHLPPRMHLAIATREDPRLPLARLRARDQLTELRAADLRFTLSEAAEFLNRVMCLDLSVEESGGCSSSWASRSVGCWRSWRGARWTGWCLACSPEPWPAR